MVKLNFILLTIIVNLLKFSVIKADSQKLKEITIEVGDPVLQQSNECPKNRKDVSLFDARIENLPANCYYSVFPKDCASATKCTHRSGIYKIQVPHSNCLIDVACDATTENGDWLVIQKRQDGSEDFYRDWSEYEDGFGEIEGEFFIGLKKLHALTNFNGPQELIVVMEDDNSTKAYAKYDSFAIGSEKESYNLKTVGKYSGTAGDSLKYNVGMKFTTKDRDNDIDTESNCAVTSTGAWWYNDCHESNLNGKYDDNSYGKGINWYHFHGYIFSLPYVKMMIRRSRTF